jgi:hypothetical protein
MASSLILTCGCTVFGKWNEETFPNRHNLLLILFAVVFIVRDAAPAGEYMEV